MTDQRMQDELLIVFGKAPVPGRVKTRLVPPLTSKESAELSQAFILDTIARHASTSRDIRCGLSAPRGTFNRHADQLRQFLGSGFGIRPQMGTGLGERMTHAFGEAFNEGYRRVVILGSDHPGLPKHFVDSAFDALRSGPAVTIGPAVDGGYYLIGMDRLYPEAFRDMSYSHNQVYSDTVDRLRETTARVVRLEEWYDVDDKQGLVRLMDDLASGAVRGLPRTRRVLNSLDALTPAADGEASGS